MRVYGIVLSAAVALAGCSDPLAKVETLSEVELSDEAPVVEAVALPEAPEAERKGLFARLLMPQKPLSDEPVATQIQDSDATAVTVPEGVAEPVPEEAEADGGVKAPRRGLAAFFRPKDKSATPAETPAAPAEVVVTAPNAAPAATVEAAVEVVEGEKPKGLFGFLKTKPTLAAPEGEAVLQTASLPVATAAKPERAERQITRRKGRVDPNAPDAQEVQLGTVLPYGKVARVCGVPRGALGKEVAKYPERGAKYRLYDSVPGSTGPHTFYITGFPDGCARQLTAALVIFGSAGMHEQLRYGLPAKVQPYSDTDSAYETVKSSVCRVGKSKPCGGQLARLEKDTVFLSLYERFGDNPRWANILLHDGQVMATDMVKK